MPIFLLFLFEAYGQYENDRYIRKINSSDGLSHNIVYDFAQDENGFIWIATQDGLNRYDGYEFKTYRFDATDPNSISGNYIRSIFIDENNTLWVSSRYGLNKYNPDADNFTSYTLPEGDELDITNISPSSHGGLWISNYAGGFHHFNTSQNTFTSYNTQNFSLGSNFVMTIHEDSYHFVWVGTENYSVQVFENKDGELIPVDNINNQLSKVNTNRVETIFEDINSNIWIGTRKGIILYHRALEKVYHILESNSPSGLSDNIILDIEQDYLGNLLIGTQEGGIDILSQEQLKANNPASFKFTKILEGVEDNQLSYRSIQAVFEDKNKNIWLGTFGNGINIIPHKQPKFKLIKHIPTNPTSINFNKVWGICEDKDGHLWIGTDGKGLNKYNFKTKEAIHYLPSNKKGSLSDNAVLSALCDSKGRLWFGTYAGGLNRYSSKTNTFETIEIGKDKTIGTNDIRCIHESEDGYIWLGTNAGGLVKLNPNTNKFESVFVESENAGAFDIRAITEDNNSGLWLGTYGAGLFYYHPKTKITKHFQFDRRKEGSLKCNIIYSLLYDEQSNLLWIGGSQNGGLNVLDLDKYIFTVYDESDGLSNKNIHAIEKDKKGRLWLSTNEGISMFNPAAKSFSNYNKLDGVQSKEFSDGSVLRSKKHKIICFGGSEGLNYFSPDLLVNSDEEIPLILTELTVYNNSAKNKSSDENDELRFTSLWKTPKVDLDHKQSSFSIQFAGLFFSNPQQIQYQYMLEGTDKNWNDLGSQRIVTFRNLKSGDYIFKVRASNEDGVWPNSFQSIDIIVNPPPWKSWWAIMIYTILVGSIIAWLYFYNLREAKIRHNLVLEKKLRAQEHEMHEERIRFFTNISHELRTPLMLLLNPLEDLVSKESPGTSKGKVYATMYRSANKLLNLINTLLEFRKTETGKLKLSVSNTNISTFIEEICIAFQGLAEKKNIKLEYASITKELLCWFDPDKMEMILNNLLSNAIKNTPEGNKIKVSVNTEPLNDNQAEFIKISVKDSGVGIPSDQLDKIFDRFYQVKGTSVNSGTGIGLALTKRLVEIHHGSITVNSEPQNGSEFIVHLPLDKSVFSIDEISETKGVSSINTTVNFSDESADNISNALSKISSISDDKKKILIIEDNTDIRAYLVDLLQKDFIIHEAIDGEEGLKKARKELPDLILSDIMMPKMNGVELCKTVKGEFQTSHIPIILITANQTHNTHIDSLEVGADAYLTKPFKPDVLITRIYNLLKSRQKLRDYYLKKFQGNSVEKEGSLNPEEEFLLQVKKILIENMSNSDFSITTLHEELGMSRTVFYNKIKSLTNLSPLDLIRQVRLAKAGELLLTKKFKVYEVMFQVGFSDEKHFRQLFKKHFGMTPTEYMNRED